MLMLGAWKVVHIFRRQHRLEGEQDVRNHKKQMAEDYAEALRQLEGLSGSMTFGDYSSYKPELTSIKSQGESSK